MENGTINLVLSREDTLQLRQSLIAGACQLHFGQSPVKIVGSQGQFLFDDVGEKYLDCASRITNVGHCHSSVVAAGQAQLETLGPGSAEHNDLQARYSQALLDTLPPSFEVCLFTSSGAQANDLALLLARQHTQKKGIVTVESAFHGALSSLIDVSPKAFKKIPTGKKDWVHVIPLPDMYRGKHAAENDAAIKYFNDAKIVIDRGLQNNGEIGCFISEPIFVVQGVIIPPAGWLAKIYSYIHELGGVVIADEVQTGMGRCGAHFWAFQSQDATPDILTIGKPMGNGYPISAVITSKKIASSLYRFQNDYSCGPVGAAIGLSVLETIVQEKLLRNASHVGQLLSSKILELKRQYQFIGDIRRLGLMVGVDIVWDCESKKPAPKLAERISYRLKDNHVIVGNEGEYENVLVFMPPLCFTALDVETVCLALDKILSEVELEDSEDIYNAIQPEPSSSTGFLFTFNSSNIARQSYLSDATESDDSNPAVNYDSMD